MRLPTIDFHRRKSNQISRNLGRSRIAVSSPKAFRPTLRSVVAADANQSNFENFFIIEDFLASCFRRKGL